MQSQKERGTSPFFLSLLRSLGTSSRREKKGEQREREEKQAEEREEAGAGRKREGPTTTILVDRGSEILLFPVPSSSSSVIFLFSPLLLPLSFLPLSSDPESSELVDAHGGYV